MTTVQKVSYNEAPPNTQFKERYRRRPLLENISSMSDEEIVCASLRNANEQAKETTAARVLQKGPSMYLAATSIAYGAMAKGTLSNKVAQGAMILAGGSIVYGVSKAVDKLQGKRLDTAKKQENNDTKEKDKYGFLKLAGATLLALGATALVANCGEKAASKLSKSLEPVKNKIKTNLDNKAKWLNNTKLGKLAQRSSDKMEQFSKVHPRLSEAAEISGIIAPAIGYASMAVELSNKVKEKKEEAFGKNLTNLVLLREAARETLQNDKD